MGNKMSCSHLDSRSGAGSSAHLVPHRNTTTERLSMRRRQLLTLSVLAPFALVACDGRQSEVSGGQAAAPNFTYSPERSEEHTSELQSRGHLVCRLLLEKKKKNASHETQ